MTKDEGDRLAWDVVRLLRAVRDELRDDRFAPVDACARNRRKGDL